MKKNILGKFFLAILAIALGVASAHAADYTAIGNVTTELTGIQGSASTLFWSFLTMSVAAIAVGVLLRFARKGIK